MQPSDANDPPGTRAPKPPAELAPTIASTTPTSPLANSGATVNAVRIGPYEVRELLGEGGFGTVYLGEQSEPVRRMVAVKVIRPERGGARFAERFASERRILASMDHPNIARVIEAGNTAEGLPWIAMEYAPGLPISRYCDQNRLALRDRVELMATVAGAVAFAHEKGIVHRDLKPGNVLVSVDGGRHVPKVIDFGIAKVLSSGEAEGAGQLLGTPGFMAPEQTVNGGEDADPRTDVYALGAMLFLLLAGVMPFEPELGGDPAAAALRLRQLDAPLMSQRLHALPTGERAEIARNRRTDPRRLARALKGELDMIVAQCLDRDRMRRYANAGALLADIRRWQQTRPVEAMPDTVLYRARKFALRHRSSVVLATLLFFSVVAGAGISAYGWYEASLRLARVQEAELRYADEASEARAAVRFLSGVLESASIDAAPHGTRTTVVDLLHEAEVHADRTLRDRPATDAAVRLALGRVLCSLGKTDDAQRNLLRGITTAQKAYGNRSSQLAAMYQALAEVSRLRKNFVAARELLTQGYDILESLPEQSARELAANRIAFADVQIDAGNAADALGELDVAARWAQECTPPDDAALSNIQWSRAMAELALGHYGLALAAAERNLAHNRTHLPSGHWWIAESETARAAALAGLGRTEEAQAQMHLAIPQLESALADDAPALRRAFARAAFVAEKAGNTAEAAALRERTHKRPSEPPAAEKPPRGTPGAQARP